MERKKKIFMMIVLTFFLLLGRVSAAEEGTCKPTELGELRSMAANVKVTYTPVTVVEKLDTPSQETDGDTLTHNFLDMKIYNMNSKLYVIMKGNGQEMTLSSRDVGTDGSITIRQIPMSRTMTYTFKVISPEYGCSGNTLRTIKVTLPKYNFYSQLGVCADIPDYYLCQEYTTYDIDGSTFYDKVDEYKAKLLTLEQAGDIKLEDDNSFISGALTTVSKNKYIIVGVVVAIGVVLTVVILKRKKSVL